MDKPTTSDFLTAVEYVQRSSLSIFHGLALVGNNTKSKLSDPELFKMWESWKDLKDLPSEKAMVRYLELLQQKEPNLTDQAKHVKLRSKL